MIKRWLALVLLFAALLSGCSGKLTRGLAAREVVVYFATEPTIAQQKAVLHACSGIPGTVAEALPKANAPLSTRVYGVRFRVDHATNKQLAKLLSCLSRQGSHGVSGYNIPSTTGGE
ncbi:MAG: hypothetical protein ACYCO3_04270 [Mycobacteriales bacterium]